ncbi:MAG: hypothetical protein ACOC7U_00300, partial [Spirochaetota bacterium]
SYALAMDIAGEASAAYLTSAFWGCLTLGRLAGIAISFTMRPGRMLLCDLGGCFVACAIIGLGGSSSAAVWTGTVLLGLSAASIFPTGINFAERNMHISGATTSWFFVGSSVGGMVFPWLIGQFFESVGPYMMVLVLLGDFFAAGLVIFITLSYTSPLLNDTILKKNY